MTSTRLLRLGIEVGPARVRLGRVEAYKDSVLRRARRSARLRHTSWSTAWPRSRIATVRVGERHSVGRPDPRRDGLPHSRPADRGAEEVDWLDHVSALELTELPDDALVVGGGAVGLELAQAFARFGSKVTIVEGIDRIAFRDDEEAAAELAAALRDEGIEIVTGAFVDRVRRDPGALVATAAGRGSARLVLLAAGRTPNVEELNLSERNRAHEGGHRGRRSPAHERRRRLGGGRRDRPVPVHADRSVPGARSRRGHATTDGAPDADYSIPTAIFTDPEPAGVGKTEREARDEGLDVEAVTHPVSAVTRAVRTRSAGSTRSSSSARRIGSSESTWSTAPRLRSCRRSRSR